MKAVIFDNDGVLTNAPEMFSNRLIRERNLDKKKVDDFFINIFVPLCMRGKADLKIELAKALPKWGIKDSVDSIMMSWFESENCIDEKVKQLIIYLRKQGIKCYLATNQEKYRTEYMIQEMGFGILFDGIFSSANIGYKKPSSEFYEKMFKEISSEMILKKDILYVDDEENNVDSGRKFGFNSFQYKNFKELEIKLKELQ